MRLSRLIEELQEVLKEEGDMEVTMTGCLLPEDNENPLPNAFESTVETHRFLNTPFGKKKIPMKRLKLFWQT